MECIVCHYCKVFWYQSKDQSVEGVLHPACQNQVRVVKRPPKEYMDAAQKKAA